MWPFKIKREPAQAWNEQEARQRRAQTALVHRQRIEAARAAIAEADAQLAALLGDDKRRAS